MRKGKNVLLKILVNNKVTKNSFFDLDTMAFCIHYKYNKGDFFCYLFTIEETKVDNAPFSFALEGDACSTFQCFTCWVC